MLGYDYSIQYKAGKNNVAPDTLSRKEELFALTGLSRPVHQFVDEIQQSCLADGFTRDIIHKINQGDSIPHYNMIGSQLFYKDIIFVPDYDNWRTKILLEFHEGLVGGHIGVSLTYKRVSHTFAWHEMLKDIKKFVAECCICQQNHYETVRPPGLLQPNTIPEKAWADISMDFIEGLPSSNGKTIILVVVDRLTKYGHFVPLSHPYSAVVVAQQLMVEVFKLHGLPESIIFDRDPVFLSAF